MARLVRFRQLPAVISGKWSVIWMLLCLGVAAVLVPMAVRLPRWVEVEAVLGAWFVVWWAVLSVLLYLGKQVNDDAAIPDWRESLGTGAPDPLGPLDSGCLVFEAEGCLAGLGATIVAAFIVAGVLLAAVFLLPAVAMLFYWAIRGMLARVVNDDHGCKGRPFLAAAHGLLWAALYLCLPALSVWTIHALRANN